MAYGLANVFRRTSPHGFVFYRKFSFKSRKLLSLFLLSQMASIGWLFAYSNELIVVNIFCLCLLFFFYYLYFWILLLNLIFYNNKLSTLLSLTQSILLLTAFVESINVLDREKPEMIPFNL